MTKEDIQKSINELVDEAWTRIQNEMKAELGEEEVEKSEEDKKEDEEVVEKSDETSAETEEATAEEESVEKSEEEASEEDSEEESVEKGSKEQEKKNETANGGKDEIKSGTPKCDKDQPMMRKSVEELSSILTEDELEVVKAWREEIGAEEEETVAKSQGGLKDDGIDVSAAIKEAVESVTSEFKKSLTEKDDLIKSMNDKIEKMASAPAYDKRSVDSLEVIEKGAGEPQPLNKSQVLETMLDLQKSGKGITSHHVAMVEGTGSISGLRPELQQLILNARKQ